MPKPLVTADGRQYVLSAEVEIDFQHIDVTGAAVTAIKLPFGAQVVGGSLIVDTAWNTTGAATLAIGDSGAAGRYGTGINLKSAARTALTITGFVSDGSEIRVTPTLADTAATAGKARVQVLYVIANRAHEVQTN